MGDWMNNEHLLADGRVFLEEKIHVDVLIARHDRPRHAADDFVKWAGEEVRCGAVR